MERSVVLITVKGGMVQDVQSTDAEVLIIIRDEDTGETGYFQWPETQWGAELDEALKGLGEEVDEK